MLPYDIVVTNPYGNRITSLSDFIQLDYGEREFEVGKLALELPDNFPDYVFRFHNRIYVHYEGRLVADKYWLLVDAEKNQDENGGWTNRIVGADPNILLDGRYAMDYSGNPRTIQVDEAAIAIFNIVTEALGVNALDSEIATNPARDISKYYEIAPPPSGTPPIYKTFAWQQTHSTINAICQSAYELGTYVGYDTVVQSNGKLQFRIYKDQRGVDRRNVIALSPEYENLTNVKYRISYADVATAVVAAGQGQEEERETVYVFDQERINQSPFGYVEYFRDARHIEDLDFLQTEANSRLNDGRPIISVTADLVERPDATWGIHFGFGDRVSVAVQGKVFDCRINAYDVTVRDGVRKVSVKLSGEMRLRRQTAEQMINYLAQDERPL